MNIREEELNISIRKFLKKVGITSQREIEKFIRTAINDGQISEDTIINAQMTLKLDGLSKPVIIEGELNVSHVE